MINLDLVCQRTGHGCHKKARKHKNLLQYCNSVFVFSSDSKSSKVEPKKDVKPAPVVKKEPAKPVASTADSKKDDDTKDR